MSALPPPLVVATAILTTSVVYLGAEELARRVRTPLLNPVLVAILVLVGLLRGLEIDYATYAQGGKVLAFFLGPAVVALGVSVHENLTALGARARAMAFACAVGGVLGVVVAAGIARSFGADRALTATLAPKSVTSPIAMEIAAHTGGFPALAAAIVVAVGVFGSVVGPPLLRLLGVRDPVAWGLAMGAAAHGVGTARAAEEGERQGAASALAMGLMGVVTAIAAPLVVSLLFP